MTVHQKVGQLFIVRPDALDPSQSDDQIENASAAGVKAMSDTLRAQLAAWPVGGVCMFDKNISDPDQITAFNRGFQAAGSVPLFIAVDEEGGLIARLANNAAFDLPKYVSMAAVGSSGDPQVAYRVGKTIGGYLSVYGFNLDFAPDADVNTNPNNPVIGTRSFSSDPQTAADMVAACVQGFHEAGTICCIKHFPGHGDTSTDSHYGTAEADKTWAEMKACEMLPFISGIAAGADLVMVAHITTPNATADGLPASLSGQMITDRLRGELGYAGVVVSDAMAMGAIVNSFGAGEAAVRFLEAGGDLILMPRGLAVAYSAVEAAVTSGRISEARLDESVLRILGLKEKYGLI